MKEIRITARSYDTAADKVNTAVMYYRIKDTTAAALIADLKKQNQYTAGTSRNKGAEMLFIDMAIGTPTKGKKVAIMQNIDYYTKQI